MRKFAAVVAVVLGLTAVPGVASAAPIGTNGCVLVNDIYECDVFADFDTGPSELDVTGFGYLPGFSLLLNTGSNIDLSDGLDAADVAHILAVTANAITLYTNSPFAGFNFDDILALALAGANEQQILGCPGIPSGLPDIDGTGYCNSADLITFEQSVNWAIGGVGGADTLRVHTALGQEVEPPPTNPVPEPGTMSLLALGGAAAAAVRRRRAAKEAKAQASSI